MNSTPQLEHPDEQLVKDAQISRLFYTLHSRVYDGYSKGIWNNQDGNWMDIISYPPPAYTPITAFMTNTGIKVLILLAENNTIVLYEREDAWNIQYTAKIDGCIEYGILDGNENIEEILKQKVLFADDL